MRNDELERRIQRNVRNLTHRDMCQLSAYLKVQTSNRKQGTQENILDHMKNLTHDELLNMSKYIDDLNRSGSSRPRQGNNQRVSESSSFSNELTSSLLKNAPIDLEPEIHYELRSDLVTSNVPYPHQLYSVPTQMVTGSNDRGNNVKIPHTLQNVQIMSSPFYCCSICLHPLTFLIPKAYPNIAQPPNRINTKVVFNLTLTENVRKILERNQFRINNKSDHKWQILIRFVGIDPGQKIPGSGDKVTEMIPPYLAVQINKNQQALWDILPSNCRTKEGKRHPKPVNVTEKISYTRLTDTGYPQEVEITFWQVPGVFTYYYMGIYLERKLTVKEMMDLFTSSRHVNNIPIENTYNFIESKLVHASRNAHHSSIEDDEDIVMANVLPVSLSCPVGKSRIEIPIRTLTCQHLQCFDAQLFLSMNERRSVWKCPVCDNQATPNDLFCDKYFAKILHHFKDDSEITDVHVLPDKTFIAITKKSKSEKEQTVESTATAPTNEVADLSLIVLDSDDEDDAGSKKKPDNQIPVAVATPPPPPPAKVPDPVPMPPEVSVQDFRWRATNTTSRAAPVSTSTHTKDTLSAIRSIHQSDPRTLSVPTTTGNVASSVSSVFSTSRPSYSSPVAPVFTTPLVRSNFNNSPSSPLRMPVSTTAVTMPTVSTNRIIESQNSTSALATGTTGIGAGSSTVAPITTSTVGSSSRIVHTTIPAQVGAPISVINGKSSAPPAGAPKSTAPPATTTTAAAAAGAPYTSKKTILSYSDLLVPDKVQKSIVDKSLSSPSLLSSSSTISSKEPPVSMVASSGNGVFPSLVSSTQQASRLNTSTASRPSRFGSMSDIATGNRTAFSDTNVVRQRSTVVNNNNNSPDIRYDSISSKSSFADVVRTPSVTMSPVPKRGTRQSDNASPEPVVCPNFIIQPPPLEPDTRVETVPISSGSVATNPPVSVPNRSVNNEAIKKSKITQSKIPPPASSVVIPSVTIDLTEEDDDVAPVPAAGSEFNNRMRFGSKDVKWMPVKSPLTTRSFPAPPITSVNGSNANTNRFARTNSVHPSGGGAHKRQLDSSGLNYFMPHQNRKPGQSQSQHQQQHSHQYQPQSGMDSSAIDLTGDDEDAHQPPKKMRGSVRTDDAEDGQVDSSDDAGDDDSNLRPMNPLASMMLQPLKNLSGKKNVPASRI